MKNTVRSWIFAFVLLGSMGAQSSAPRTIGELQQEIEKVLRETGTPGAAVAIVGRDKVEWVAGLGLADMAKNRPATSKTLFRLGSVSKELVALAALKLQEEGELKLTDTLRQWVPECPIQNPWEDSDPVRLVHLLEHTSGVPDWRGSAWAHNDSKPVTTSEALAFEPGNRYVRWRPGSRSAYTNYGAMLATAIVEKAAGQRFEEYVREKIFVPLGMNTAGYFLTPAMEQAITTTYRGHVRQPMPYWHAVYRPAGAISASAEDMASYVRFHLQRGSVDGRRILSGESMDRLERPGTLPMVQAGVVTGYGLFSEASVHYSHEEHGHRGQVEGALAMMGYIPELGVGRVVMINSDNQWAAMRIWSAVGSYLMRDIAPPAMPPVVPVSAELRRSLAGYYTNIAPRDSDFLGLFEHYGNLRKLSVDPQGMTMRSPLGGPTERWVALSEKLFRREGMAKPALALIPGESGGTLLQYGQMTYERISPVRVWFPISGFVGSFLLAVSSLLFAVVWGLRMVLGRLPNPGPWSVRVWPLLGAAALVGVFWLHAQADSRGAAVLGTANLWTVGMMLASLLIPIAAFFSVVAVWRHRRAPMNRWAYWHAVLVTVGHVFMAGFFISWGMVGVRMWG